MRLPVSAELQHVRHQMAVALTLPPARQQLLIQTQIDVLEVLEASVACLELELAVLKGEVSVAEAKRRTDALVRRTFELLDTEGSLQ